MTGPPRRSPSVSAPERFTSQLFGSTNPSANLLIIALILLALIVIVWVLFLPPFLLLRGNSEQSAGSGYGVKLLNTVPSLPSGLAPASRYYQVLDKKDGGAVSISLPLLDPKGSNRALSFYSFQASGWQRVAPALIGPDGASAQAQIQNLPNNLILLKREAGATQVYGSLPANKNLNPEAAQQITVLNPSGFVPSGDGSLKGDEPPIVPGAQFDVIPAVVAINGDPAQAVSDILASPDKESAHLSALIGLSGKQGNNGVELDYLSVLPQSRQSYSDFVTVLAQELHKNRQTLGIELPAPILSGSGWNSGSYDWTAIAKSADYIKVVPDLDQSLYRKQMPDLLHYLTSDAGIDAHKLVLVTTPYSIEKSDKGTRALTRLEALSIASQVQVQDPEQAATNSTVGLVAANLDHSGGGSGIVWDSSTASVSFAFKSGDATHQVWIQNIYSEGFKLEYANLNHLGGVAVDDASNDPAIADLWPSIAQYMATGSPQLLQPNPQLLVPSWLVDGRPLPTDGKTVFSWQTPAQAGQHAISLIVGDGEIRVIGTRQILLKAGTSTPATGTPSAGVPPTATPRTAPPTAAITPAR
jgi:spore germination protein YaaH